MTDIPITDKISNKTKRNLFIAGVVVLVVLFGVWVSMLTSNNSTSEESINEGETTDYSESWEFIGRQSLDSMVGSSVAGSILASVYSVLQDPTERAASPHDNEPLGDQKGVYSIIIAANSVVNIPEHDYSFKFQVDITDGRSYEVIAKSYTSAYQYYIATIITTKQNGTKLFINAYDEDANNDIIQWASQIMAVDKSSIQVEYNKLSL
jgi:hypothetical protein